MAGILALRSEWRGAAVVTLHNLSPNAAEAHLPPGTGELRRLLGDAEDGAPEGPDRPIVLDGYGFRWFRIQGERR
jgi:maltose alpha-D-glucosyltransferase/alpha-amylase